MERMQKKKQTENLIEWTFHNIKMYLKNKSMFKNVFDSCDRQIDVDSWISQSSL